MLVTKLLMLMSMTISRVMFRVARQILILLDYEYESFIRTKRQPSEESFILDIALLLTFPRRFSSVFEE